MPYLARVLTLLTLSLTSIAVTAAEKPADNADQQTWCRHVHARVLAVNPAPGEEFIALCAKASGRSVDYYKCVDLAMDSGKAYAAAGDGCGRKYP